MKKNIVKLFLLSLILIIISLIVTTIMGKTYTMRFKIHTGNHHEITLNNETGEVVIIGFVISDIVRLESD